MASSTTEGGAVASREHQEPVAIGAATLHIPALAGDSFRFRHGRHPAAVDGIADMCRDNEMAAIAGHRPGVTGLLEAVFMIRARGPRFT